MEHEEKVQELAKTLKSSGLAASMEDALERAREILKPKKVNGVQEKLVENKDSPGYDITKEDGTVSELMAEDAEKIYQEDKAEEPKKVLLEEAESDDFMVKTWQELEEEKSEKKVDLSEVFDFEKKE